MAPGFWATALGVALAAAAPAMADEAPKYGGILTYMIPADSPPSFDAQREEIEVDNRRSASAHAVDRAAVGNFANVMSRSLDRRSSLE